MSASDPTRIEVAEALVRHSALHQQRFWGDLAKLPEVIALASEERMERGLFWNFEFAHAIEDLRSALEYGAYDAYERFVCSNHQAGTVHRAVTFPLSDSQATFQSTMSLTGKNPIWKFRDRGARIEAVFLSAQPFSATGDSWLEELHELWNERKHRNPNYFSARLRLEPNPDAGSIWPLLLHQELVISGTNRSLRDFFAVATRETGRVVAELGRALYS